MQYGSSVKRAFATSIVLGAALASAPAAAEIVPCFGTMGPCPPTVSCNDDAECFALGAGRCVNSGGGGGGTCSPDCNAAFSCNGDSDCPRFDPLIVSCQATSATGVPGVCTYYDPSDRAFVTLCGATGSTVGGAQLSACFSGTSWALGDCDMDGVLNGVDANPCDGTVHTLVPAVPSPFCLPGRVCEGVSNVCAPFLHCMSSDTCGGVADRVGAVGAWECSTVPGTTASFCHPSCDATIHCSTTTDCAMLGSCRFVDATLAMCMPTRMSTCASSCMADPLDWATGQGDCDGDGAQNGCDANPCTTGDAPCAFNHVCAVDAGVVTLDASVEDAGTNQEDAFTVTDDAASTEDASTPPMDAGTTQTDGGNVAMDANGPPEVTPGLGFGGGGGCRCAVAGGRARGDGGAYLGLAIAMIVIARRRRRPLLVTRR